MESNIGSHSLTLRDNKLFLTGVKKVKFVSETSFTCILPNCNLQICGSGLHIVRLEVSQGEVELEGNISNIKYGGAKNKQSLIKRIFG